MKRSAAVYFLIVTRSPFLEAAYSVMYNHVPKLEVLFEDRGVCSDVITDSLVLERAVYEQRALSQSQPTALQLDNRQKGSIYYSISPSLMPSQLTPVNLHFNSWT